MRTNVAYDLNSFSEQTYTPNIRVLKTKQLKTKQVARPKNKINLIIVLDAIILVFFMALTVNSRTTLIETQNEVNIATSSLNRINSENAYYNYKLESSISLKSAEDYARNELGLIKRDANQVEYIKLNDQNKIVVENKELTTYQHLQNFWNLVIDFVI